MLVKFVAEVLKGLFGVSEQSTDEAETETSITVEREAGEASADESAEAGETSADESAETGEASADESAETGEASADESAETGEASADESTETGGASADESTETDEPVDSGGAGEPVEGITGIGPTYSERLSAVGIETVGDLAETDEGKVAEAAAVSESRAADWVAQAEDW